MPGALLFLVFSCALCLLPSCTAEESPPSPAPVPVPTSTVPLSAADSDGDGLSDAQEDPEHKLHEDSSECLDSDHDGIPDFLDLDSDGDTISDGDEAGDLDLSTPPRDSDGDGTPDFLDLDSDGDGLSDHREAGDEDPATPPNDADGDGIADAHERDSDGDGIADDHEVFRYHTDPRLLDTDGDGVPDLIEIYQSSDPLDAESAPPAYGTPVFVIPSGAPPFPAQQIVRARVNIQHLDLYMVLDASDSMKEELRAMRDRKTGLATMIDRLTCHPEPGDVTCKSDAQCSEGFICTPRGQCLEDPAQKPCVPDIWTGVGRFGNLDTYENLLSLQPDAAKSAAHIPKEGQPARPDGKGGALTGPWAEAPFQVPVCVAEPDECLNQETIHCSEDPDRLGCPGFRVEALRVHMQISDADNQCSDPSEGAMGTQRQHYKTTHFGMGRCARFTPERAGRALSNLRVRFIGLHGKSRCDYAESSCDNFPQANYNEWLANQPPSRSSGRPILKTYTPRSTLLSIGEEAKSVDAKGHPFVFEALDEKIVRRGVRAVREILANAPLRVEIDVKDLNPEDNIDAKRWIKRLEVSHAKGCESSTDTRDSNADGYDDGFSKLLPGSTPCWSISISKTATLPDQPSLEAFLLPGGDRVYTFRARLTVYGDGSPLDHREVLFLVPEKSPRVYSSEAPSPRTRRP